MMSPAGPLERTGGLAWPQGLVGIATMSVVLDSTMNATDCMVESRAAENLGERWVR